MNARVVLVLVLAMAPALVPPVAASPDDQASPRRTSLRTIEGTVTVVFSRPAEGDLDVVAVALDAGTSEPDHLDLLLAPQQVLDEIDFGLEVGDRLRARVFVTEQGPLKVHKALNLTRGTMVRFRSLREVPLWGASGNWEGGSCRRQGGHGGGHGHGAGGGGGPRR